MQLKTNTNYLYVTKRKEDLLKHIKHALYDYFNSNSYPAEVINEIMDEGFIDSNPSYYLYYPYLFNTYFQIKDKVVQFNRVCTHR